MTPILLKLVRCVLGDGAANELGGFGHGVEIERLEIGDWTRLIGCLPFTDQLLTDFWHGFKASPILSKSRGRSFAAEDAVGQPFQVGYSPLSVARMSARSRPSLKKVST